MEYMFVFDQERTVHKNERYVQIITQNKCSVTLVAIEHLWHRIKENKHMCWFPFFFVLFFFVFGFSFFLYLFISTALPLSKSAGDDDTLST